VFEEFFNRTESTGSQRNVLDTAVGDVQAPDNEPVLLEAPQNPGRLAGIHAQVAAQFLDRRWRVDMQETEAQELFDRELGPVGEFLARLPTEEHQVQEALAPISRVEREERVHEYIFSYDNHYAESTITCFERKKRYWYVKNAARC